METTNESRWITFKEKNRIYAHVFVLAMMLTTLAMTVAYTWAYDKYYEPLLKQNNFYDTVTIYNITFNIDDLKNDTYIKLLDLDIPYDEKYKTIPSTTVGTTSTATSTTTNSPTTTKPIVLPKITVSPGYRKCMKSSECTKVSNNGCPIGMNLGAVCEPINANYTRLYNSKFNNSLKIYCTPGLDQCDFSVACMPKYTANGGLVGSFCEKVSRW